MQPSLNIIRLRGAEILPYIAELAKLRIKVFHDYPYLYIGDEEYEKKYLQTYINCAQSVMVVVFDDTQIVGASTAIPMQYAEQEFQKPFIAKGMDIKKIFYFGESVLLKQYRGLGVGKRFFLERETAANENQSALATFCAIDRPLNDPKRPADYQPLDTFWNQQGFTKHPELVTTYHYQEIGETGESLKPFVFWVKTL